MEENQVPAEAQDNTPAEGYPLSFHGKGSEYFGIVIVNWLLTVLTLGFYYPWAKEKQLKYIYGATEFKGDRLAFHGTGKEMFRGYIKALVIYGLIIGILFWSQSEQFIAGILIAYALIIAVIPLAIHGSYRYRMSRTSWRGIRFGYRGDRNELMISFYKWIALTIVTLGIYGSWMSINLRTYLMQNVRFGNLKFDYDGDGLDYFFLNLKGMAFTYLTLGIYIFWYQKNLFEYYVDNLSLEHEGQRLKFTSIASGGDFAGLILGNLAIMLFTLGLGYAWVVTRSMKFFCDHIEIEGDIDLDQLLQTEENLSDATGEELGELLDIDMIF